MVQRFDGGQNSFGNLAEQKWRAKWPFGQKGEIGMESLNRIFKRTLFVQAKVGYALF